MHARELLDALGSLRPDLRRGEASEKRAEAGLAAIAARYPGLPLEPPALARRLARCLPEGLVVDEALESVALADLALADAVERRSRAALEIFSPLAAGAIDEAIGAVGGAEAIADEVRSQVMVRIVGPRGGDLAPAIAGYRGACPLRNWVRVIAVRDAVRRARNSPSYEDRGEDPLAAVMAADLGAELNYMKDLYREHVRHAFAEALASLDARQLTLLRQHVLDELTFDQMAPLHGVGRSTIGRRLAKARAQIGQVTRQALAARLDIPKSEVDSVIRLVESQLDITLGPLRQLPTA